jgi:hypothetical protein
MDAASAYSAYRKHRHAAESYARRADAHRERAEQHRRSAFGVSSYLLPVALIGGVVGATALGVRAYNAQESAKQASVEEQERLQREEVRAQQLEAKMKREQQEAEKAEKEAEKEMREAPTKKAAFDAIRTWLKTNDTGSRDENAFEKMSDSHALTVFAGQSGLRRKRVIELQTGNGTVTIGFSGGVTGHNGGQTIGSYQITATFDGQSVELFSFHG